jgi:hypothetical protein
MAGPTRLYFGASLLLCAVLAGCSSRTDVSATGNVPGQYSHVYITAQAVWFNASATAGPDDSGWTKFPLSTPATVDLVTDSGGNFGTLVTDLKLGPGSYSQVRIIPVDASTPLTVSAQTLGALYNAEADYVDSAGTTHQLPLELLNPDRGIGIQAGVSVPLGNIGAALGAATATGTTTPASTAFTPTTTTTPATSTFGTSGTTGTSSTTTTVNFALSIDGARDLTAFNYGGTSPTSGTPAVMLSSHASLYDLSASGGIQGTLTLTNLTSNITGASGLPDIQVSAELLSTDGTRHYVVTSTPVNSDGSFTLYPLVANSSNITYYDLVIHGGGIATIIIKQVQIPPTGSSSTSTSTSTLTPSTPTTTPTSTPTITPTITTASTTSSDLTPITPTNLVSIGTLIPRAATTYTANIAAPTGSPLPAGAEVAFYQTLPNSGEVPYVIEASPIDPFKQNLANPQLLSTGTVDAGTYVSNGATVTVVSSQPHETAGTYQVAATAPLYADGLLDIEVNATTTTPVAVAALSLASGSTSATLAATVSPATSGKYNQGQLLVTHDGQLVASAPLNTVLSGGGIVQVTGIPGGTAASLYYLTVRAWNSSDPSGTLTRQWYSTPVDLRSASSASAQLTVN